MNLNEYIHLLNNPGAVNYSHINDLDKILADFPYFQSARTIQLKGLHAHDSFKYSQALKLTAAHTVDRTVLFDFINGYFTPTLKKVSEDKEPEKKTVAIATEPSLIEEKTLEVPQKTVSENSLEKSILSSIKEATPAVPSAETEKIEAEETASESVATDEKPVGLNTSETHSFQEWLQLSKLKPIERNESTEVKVESKTLAEKIDLIDKFIESNPKISPPKENIAPPAYTQKNEDTSYLMTETLAKIYLEQRKYSKAIQAYEILILKYPEKSSLFADRILEIKELQQNNK
ncbi:tetratricopeptide repeat protein [Flavobacterium luminosum]|uniref:Tetratricopeptide repeat protein n=1 Tax=Flavobacterium luminosum TaxID=2949086 RepID=A0ABT0TKN2_9FLAO|nr:tetratricopeptide repeat protein [Flavobacterium sp. HXWNR70]MCL9807955.1 hypothetical protein [Flavobacterium sp. HXWNR70]